MVHRLKKLIQYEQLLQGRQSRAAVDLCRRSTVYKLLALNHKSMFFSLLGSTVSSECSQGKKPLLRREALHDLLVCDFLRSGSTQSEYS